MQALVVAQISNYLENESVARCAGTLVVAPKITAEMLGGSFEPHGLTNASNMLARAVAEKYDNSEIIQAADLGTIDGCSSPVIVVKLKSYHKEAARIGQFRGYITVQVLFFDTSASKKPREIREFSARGGVFWGDSTPFNKALDSVVGQMRASL
jgi:hypothetical protein